MNTRSTAIVSPGELSAEASGEDAGCLAGLDWGKATLMELHRSRWTNTFVWLGFLAAFGAGELILLVSFHQGLFWTTVLLTLVLAHLMHAHLIAFHEAAHHSLCPSQFWNDVFGVFLGTLSFMSFTCYRVVHHTHHCYLATERDEELWPFVMTDTRCWLRRFAAGLELLLGIVYTPLLFLRSFLRPGSPVRSRAARRRIWAEFTLIAAHWGALIGAVAYFHVWPYFLVLYVIPAVLAGNLQSLRKYIEHMGLHGTTVLSSTRNIVNDSWAGRLVAFSLFNEPFHGVHHKYARLPHDKMPGFADELTPHEPWELPPFQSYRRAFMHMARRLADPQVGGQWQNRPGQDAHP